jgi:hypothetical protein
VDAVRPDVQGKENDDGERRAPPRQPGRGEQRGGVGQRGRGERQGGCAVAV